VDAAATPDQVAARVQEAFSHLLAGAHVP
jgi:hypothetical protein